MHDKRNRYLLIYLCVLFYLIIFPNIFFLLPPYNYIL